MNSRATYSFSGYRGGPCHFYIHHDGHPASAASKLIDALEATPEAQRRDGAALAAAFAATQKTKPCSDLAALGDLDWRWEVAAAEDFLLITGWHRIHGSTLADDHWYVAYGPESLDGFLAGQALEISRQRVLMAEWSKRNGCR